MGDEIQSDCLLCRYITILVLCKVVYCMAVYGMEVLHG